MLRAASLATACDATTHESHRWAASWKKVEWPPTSRWDCVIKSMSRIVS